VSDDALSDAQQTLIDTLAKLDELDLGGSEPAPTFRPPNWVAAQPPGFDLGAVGPRAGTSAEPAQEAGSSEATESTQGPQEAPPPCPSIAEIVERVNGGEDSAQALAESSLARIAGLDAEINAVVTRSPERARREAGIVDEVVAEGERPRPLAGVPLLHKDIIATEGIRTTAGSALLLNHVPESDATVVSRLSNAGALLIGKANTHEFATGTTGTVSVFGPTRNPWNIEHIAGGSSCGSAAALAAGFVAAATGTDTGGSIRIPSACCGTVGLKPTYGRVSRAGVFPFAWSLDHVGPMGRRVADVAALLTAIAGADPFDRASAAEPSVDFGAALGGRIEGTRFAVPTFRFLELATAPVADAIREAARVLEDLGATRVDVDMPKELALVGPAAIALFLAEGGAVHHRTLASHPEAYCRETTVFLGLADRVSAHAYVQAQRIRALLGDRFARVFQATDLLLTPTLAITAPRIDAREVEGADGPMDVRAAMTLFTRPFNLTGLPALSLPCGFHEGLPIGLQIVGRPYDESTVLRAAHAYEEATEWHERRPPE